MKDQTHAIDKEVQWNKILHFCNYRERCEKEVLKKLSQLDLDELDREDFFEKLIRLKMVDDQRFASSFCQGKFNIKHWGKNKIRQELLAKNIRETFIDEALSIIDMDEYLAKLDRLYIAKKKSVRAKNDLELRAKIYRYLYFKGYESELIQNQFED